MNFNNFSAYYGSIVLVWLVLLTLLSVACICAYVCYKDYLVYLENKLTLNEERKFSFQFIIKLLEIERSLNEFKSKKRFFKRFIVGRTKTLLYEQKNRLLSLINEKEFPFGFFGIQFKQIYENSFRTPFDEIRTLSQDKDKTLFTNDFVRNILSEKLFFLYREEGNKILSHVKKNPLKKISLLNEFFRLSREYWNVSGGSWLFLKFRTEAFSRVYSLIEKIIDDTCKMRKNTSSDIRSYNALAQLLLDTEHIFSYYSFNDMYDREIHSSLYSLHERIVQAMEEFAFEMAKGAIGEKEINKEVFLHWSSLVKENSDFVKSLQKIKAINID